MALSSKILSIKYSFRYLFNSGVFYRTAEEVGTCPGGSLLALRPAGNHGMMWRCSGIVNPTTGVRCCQGTMVSPRLNSFFANRNLDPSVTLEILFFWLRRTRRTQIAETVGVSRNTVRLVLNDWYQLLQEDLQERDMQIGIRYY
jgi:hypothetical protein